MKYFKEIAAGVAALSMLGTIGVANAAPLSVSSAEKVRKLDIMLMVSSLRCRHGVDSFQTEYRKFSANHLTELNDASQTLSNDLARKYGSKGAKRALDKMSVSMANSYGQGHPWMSCSDLKQVTGDLAGNREPGALLIAADELLAANRSVAMR